MEKIEKMKRTNLPQLVDRNFLKDYFNVSIGTLINWEKKGVLKPLKIGGAYRYRKYDIKKLIEIEKK